MASGKAGYLRDKIINQNLGAAAYTPPATVYVGVTTTIPSAATGGTEPTIGTAAYARVAVTNNTTNFPTVSSGLGNKTNATAVTFPTSTASWAAGATLVGYEIWDAATAGNRLYWGEMISNPIVVVPTDTGDLFTATAHGLTAGTQVEMDVENGTFPTNFADNTSYFVISANTNDFQLSATSGGSAIVVTAAVGSGTIRVYKTYKQPVAAAGVTLSFAIGTLSITES